LKNPIELKIWEAIKDQSVYIVGSTAYSYYFQGIEPEDIDIIIEGKEEEYLESTFDKNFLMEMKLPYSNKCNGIRLDGDGIKYDIWVEKNLNNYLNNVGLNIYAMAYNPKDGSFRCNEHFLNAMANRSIDIIDKEKMKEYINPNHKIYEKLRRFIYNDFNLSIELENWLDENNLR